MPEEITNLPREQTTQGKVKRNLQYWIAGALTVMIIIVMAINLMSTKKAAIKKPPTSDATPPPQLDALRNTIAQQALEGRQKPPELPSALPPLPNPPVPNIPADAAKSSDSDEARRRAKADAELEIRRSAIMALQGSGNQEQRSATDANGTDQMMLQQLLNAQKNNVPPVPLPGQSGSGKIAETAQAREDWQRQASLHGTNRPLHADPVGSPYTLFEGSVLPAVLITQINSEIPGMVTAQVTENVYDGVNGQTLVIPQGTRLVGTYNTDVEFGQERLQLSFHRLIYPSGASVDLGSMTAADGKGQSGLHDKVNTHMLAMLTSSFALAKLAQVLAATHPNNGTPSIVNFSGTDGSSYSLDPSGQILLDAGHVLLDRYRTRPTTLVIRQGFRFNVMVARDMELPPPTTARRW